MSPYETSVIVITGGSSRPREPLAPTSDNGRSVCQQGETEIFTRAEGRTRTRHGQVIVRRGREAERELRRRGAVREVTVNDTCGRAASQSQVLPTRGLGVPTLYKAPEANRSTGSGHTREGASGCCAERGGSGSSLGKRAQVSGHQSCYAQEMSSPPQPDWARRTSGRDHRA